MSTIASLRRSLVALALLGLLPLAGCGKKGDPAPPILRVPAPTKDLSVVQRGDRLLVELGYPQTTAVGTPLGGLDALTVKTLLAPLPGGATGDPAAAPEIDERQFTAGAAETLVLEGEDLTSAVRGDRIAFDLAVPEPEVPAGDTPSALTLAVTTRGPDGQVSALSNRITYPLVEPPEPPSGIEANGLAAGIRVRWSHPMIDLVRERLRAEATEAGDESTEADEGTQGVHGSLSTESGRRARGRGRQGGMGCGRGRDGRTPATATPSGTRQRRALRPGRLRRLRGRSACTAAR
jgi:hypothetical protein